MRHEMEIMWQAMKSSHYQRVIERLEDAIRATDDLKAAFSAALGMVVEAVHAQTGTFWFYDRMHSGYIFPYAVYNGADLKDVSLRPGEGIAGQVIESGQPMIIKDCQADPYWAGHVDKKTGFETKSMICVPLSVEGKSFGSIQIINQTNGQLFDEKDLAFAQSLALEAAKLFTEHGLLEEYFGRKKESAVEVTFRDIVFASSTRDMERRLYKMSEYAALPLASQKEVLRLVKALRDCFANSRR